MIPSQTAKNFQMVAGNRFPVIEATVKFIVTKPSVPKC